MYEVVARRVLRLADALGLRHRLYVRRRDLPARRRLHPPPQRAYPDRFPVDPAAAQGSGDRPTSWPICSCSGSCGTRRSAPSTNSRSPTRTGELEPTSPWAPKIWPFYLGMMLGDLRVLPAMRGAMRQARAQPDGQGDPRRSTCAAATRLRRTGLTVFDINTAIWMFPVLFALVFLGIPVAISLLVTALLFGLSEFGSASSRPRSTAVCAIPRPTSSWPRSRCSSSWGRCWSGRESPSACSSRCGSGSAAYAAGSRSPRSCSARSSRRARASSARSRSSSGLMAVPAMMKAGYKKDLAAGSVCAGGSLGTTIPPSVVIIIYASIVEMSVGDLFAGIMIPAFSMVAMFMIYILGRCLLQPDAGPGLPGDEIQMSLGQKIWLGIDVAGARARPGHHGSGEHLRGHRLADRGGGGRRVRLGGGWRYVTAGSGGPRSTKRSSAPSRSRPW